jgi:geranylgeranyl reductase family protein
MLTQLTADVVIVGAGPAGSAAAYYLARQGADVLLLDRATFPREKTCGDGLTPLALGVLAEMGLLADLEALGRTVRRVILTSPAGHVVRSVIPKVDGLPGQALVVPRLTLDDQLRRRAMAAGARFSGGAHVTGVSRAPAGRLTVTVESAGAEFTACAHLLIVATGANPRLLQALGLQGRLTVLARAARAYFEDIPDLDDAFAFSFPPGCLPGYAWIFPVSGACANVGVIHYDRSQAARAPAALAAFQAADPRLCGARRLGPVKGYPLRVDFLSAPTHAHGVLIAGEAAGLVNPLTGEGIDLALESGRLAAEHAARALRAGELSAGALAPYRAALRARFAGLFRAAEWVRRLCLNAPVLDRLCAAAPRRPAVERVLLELCLGLARPSPAAVLQVAWAAMRG